MNDRELDKLFKNKLDNRQFEFKEQYWNEVEKLIAAQESGTPVSWQIRFFYGTLSLVIVPCLLSAFMLFNQPALTQTKSAEHRSGIDGAASHATTTNDGAIQTVTGSASGINQTDHMITTTAGLADKDKTTAAAASTGKDKDRTSSSFTRSGKSDRKKRAADSGRPVSEKKDRKIKNSTGTGKNNDRTAAKQDRFFTPAAWQQNATAVEQLNLSPDPIDRIYTSLSAAYDPGSCTGLSALSAEAANKKWHGHASVVAGAGIYEGLLNTGRRRAATGLSPVIGIKYTLGFKSRFSLHSGLIYAPRQGLNSQRSYETYRYSFGQITRKHTAVYKHLHYMEMPLYVRWRFFGAHHITIGGSLSYQLFAVKMLETTREGTNGNSETSRELLIGRNEGFTNSDVSLLFGYEHYISKRLGLGIRFEHGLSDLTSNSRFNNSIKDNNIRGLILLEYAIAR